VCFNSTSSGGVWLRGTLHRFDCVSRVPVKIVLLPFITVTCVALNVTEHPLSHIWPTDSNECWANPGRMCARRADGGNEGIFKVAVCVDVIVSPLGRCTSNGVVVGCFSEQLALAKRKCAVHPESNSAVHDDGCDGVKLR
jgi:hypothetical protein